jgi:hypothetical protein
VSCDVETKVVLSGEPFHVTTVPLENPEPVAVSVNAAPPATAVFGEMLVRVSAGLIVNVAGLETSVPFCAVIDAEPGCAIRLAATVAMICPELTDVKGSAVEFQYTTVLLLKPPPLTVSVKAGPPAVAEAGEMLEIAKVPAMTNGRGAGAV